MKKPLLAVVLMIAGLAAAAAATPLEETLAKARTYIGGEAAVNAVQSVTYVGNVVDADGNVMGPIKLVLKKPRFQRIEITLNGVQDVTGVNEFEAWMQRTDLATGERMVAAMPYERVQNLYITAIENLFFFKGPEHFRGAVIEDGGVMEREKRQVRKITARYPTGLFFTRYFDVKTGELLGTETADGVLLVEDGKLPASGVKFPKSVKTYHEGKLVRTVVFEKITVNDVLSDELFEFPKMKPNPVRAASRPEPSPAAPAAKPAASPGPVLKPSLKPAAEPAKPAADPAIKLELPPIDQPKAK